LNLGPVSSSSTLDGRSRPSGSRRGPAVPHCIGGTRSASCAPVELVRVPGAASFEATQLRMRLPLLRAVRSWRASVEKHCVWNRVSYLSFVLTGFHCSRRQERRPTPTACWFGKFRE
jgi:hypothetical protein